MDISFKIAHFVLILIYVVGLKHDTLYFIDIMFLKNFFFFNAKVLWAIFLHNDFKKLLWSLVWHLINVFLIGYPEHCFLYTYHVLSL